MFTHARAALAAGVVVIGVTALAGPFVTPAHAETTQSIPVSDRDGSSATGPGGPFILRGEGLDALIVGGGFSGGEWRTAMEFDLLNTLPQVLQAKLTIMPEVVANPPANFQVHGYVGNGSVTASDMLTSNPVTPVLTAPSTFPPAYDIDVTAFVQQVVSSNQRYAGFTFKGFPGSSGLSMQSKEANESPPTLTIVAVVPEPASALPVLGAMCALASCRRGRAASRNSCRAPV